MNNNICKQCGKEFKAENNRRKYCNEECRKERNREYDRVRKSKERKNMSEGQKTVLAEKQSKRAKKIRKENKQPRVCRVCEVEFIPNHNGTKTYDCSVECYKERRRTYNRERWRQQNPDWNKDVTIICEWCGKNHTVPGRTAHQARFCSNKCNDTWWSRQRGYRPIEEREKEWEEMRERSRRKAIAEWSIRDWEYIGGHSKGNTDIQMKCLHCTRVVTTKIDNIKDRKTFECVPECVEEVKHKQEQLRLLEEERKKKEEWESLPVKECSVCDNEFKSWQPTQVTCSRECRRTYANRKRRAYDKAYRYKVEVVDNDITIEGLFERDQGVCHICNEKCNQGDFEIKNGAFIVGRTYPSIDHVVPRSKGGVHSWENVKLAHHYCNTIKSNNENEQEVIERLRELKRELVL